MSIILKSNTASSCLRVKDYLLEARHSNIFPNLQADSITYLHPLAVHVPVHRLVGPGDLKGPYQLQWFSDSILLMSLLTMYIESISNLSAPCPKYRDRAARREKAKRSGQPDQSQCSTNTSIWHLDQCWLAQLRSRKMNLIHQQNTTKAVYAYLVKYMGTWFCLLSSLLEEVNRAVSILAAGENYRFGNSADVLVPCI